MAASDLMPLLPGFPDEISAFRRDVPVFGLLADDNDIKFDTNDSASFSVHPPASLASSPTLALLPFESHLPSTCIVEVLIEAAGPETLTAEPTHIPFCNGLDESFAGSRARVTTGLGCGAKAAASGSFCIAAVLCTAAVDCAILLSS